MRHLTHVLAAICILAGPGLAQNTARTAPQAPTSGSLTTLPAGLGVNATLTPTAGTLTTLSAAMGRTQDPQVVMGIKNHASVSPAIASSVKTPAGVKAKAAGNAAAHSFIEHLSDEVVRIQQAKDHSAPVIEKLYTGAKDASDLTVDPVNTGSSMGSRLHRTRPRLLPGASIFAPRKETPAPGKESRISIPVAAVIAVMTAIFVIAMAAAALAAGPAAAVGMIQFSSMAGAIGAIAAFFMASVFLRYSPLASWLRGAKKPQ